MTSRTRDGSARVPRKYFRARKKGVTETGEHPRRPKTVERPRSRLLGERRPADPSARDDWQRPATPDLDGLTEAQREVLAEAWLSDGLARHADVASHARFTLRLLALGAPPDMVRASQRASLDVFRHAEDSFSLASAYGQRAFGPGELGDGASIVEPGDAREAVVVAIRVGCIDDTIGAMAATVAAETCRDEVVAKILRRIAVDQTRHAGLAWRFVRWALSEIDGGLHRAVDEAFERALGEHPPVDEHPAPDWMRLRGRLSRQERACLAASTLREVIQPCAEAVLATRDDASNDDLPFGA